MDNTLEHYEQHLRRILPIPKAWHVHTQGCETRVLMNSPLFSGQCQLAIFDKDCPYYCFGFLACQSRHKAFHQIQEETPLLERKPITPILQTQTVFIHPGFKRPHFALCRDIDENAHTINFTHLNLTECEEGFLPGLPESGSAFELDVSDIKRDGSFLLERAEGPRKYSIWNKEPFSQKRA